MKNYLLVLIIPIITVICGVVSLNRPPKEINSLYGYRTARSMRDKRSWDYAQSMLGEYFIYYAIASFIVGLILSVICRIFFNREYAPSVIMLIQTAGIFSLVFVIESNLKKEHKRWDEK